MNRLFKILFLIFILSDYLFGESQEWYKEQVAQTTWNGWEDKFYSCDESGQLWVNKVGGNNVVDVEKSKVFKFPFKPEKIKHYPLKDGNIVAAWSNQKHSFYAVILNKEDEVIQKEKLKLPNFTEDVEVRVGQGRRIAVLFSGQAEGKYFIKLWFDERFQNIMIQNVRPEESFLHWSKLSIHYLFREDIKTYWTVWSKGRFNSYELPFAVTTVQFIQWKDTVYLIAKDTSYTIWKMGIRGDKLERVKLYQNNSFEHAFKVQPLIEGNNLNIFLCSSLEMVLYRLIVTDFEDRRPSVRLRTKPLISESLALPGYSGNEIYWVESDSSEHSYVRRWDEEFEPIVKFNWRVVNRDGYPDLYLSWERGTKGNYEYRYILNKEKNSLPLPDYGRPPNDEVNYKMKDDGEYYFHLQAREIGSGWESPVYHLPVFWQYTPDMPELLLLNEISPRVVTGRYLDFVIKNAVPLNYYGEINKIPVYDPERSLRVVSGKGRITHDFEVGRYYLHVRVKDKRTNQFSETMHLLFFYETMKLEQSVGLKEYNENLSELRMILDKIDSTRYDPVENERWRRRLKEFQDELEKSIEKPSKK